MAVAGREHIDFVAQLLTRVSGYSECVGQVRQSLQAMLPMTCNQVVVPLRWRGKAEPAGNVA